MDYVKKFGEVIKSQIDGHPERARKMINLGLHEEVFRMKHFAPKQMPKAYKRLNTMALGSVLTALEHPKQSCWTNIFAPVEILQCFGFKCVSMECLSSFMSGFNIEDFLISYAENEGIAPTLCSYHKNFIGGVDCGLLPKAPLYVTTSMVCDGNINTFRHMERKHGVEGYVIDIPHEYSYEAEMYVVDQLRELIRFLEKKTGKQFDMEQLKRTLERENLSKAYYKEFLHTQSRKYYPNTLTLDLYMLFATHLDIGSQVTLEFFKELKEDIKNYPDLKGKGIFWVNVMPYYQETLKDYFNYQEKYFIQGCDMNMDYMEELDTEHPLNALAKKMLLNNYNGSFERKSRRVRELAQEFHSDAVINFCHWGCKQSSGGVMLLKEEMKKAGIPMMILDGDAVDRRNSHDGQIKTRLEAFLEMVDSHEEEVRE